MRVGACLSDVKAFKYSHGGTYTDPVTNKPRQYDFRAAYEEENRRTILAIECKNLGNESPIVICGVDRQLSEAYHDFIDSRMGRFVERGKTSVGASSTTYRASGDLSFYPAGKFVGKSLLRMKKDKRLTCVPDSDVYDRWSQALASSYELTDLSCTAGHKLGKQHFYSVILPVVVVPDGTLWQAAYDDQGNLSFDPCQKDGVEFYVDRLIRVSAYPEKDGVVAHNFCFSHIHFLTLTGFKSFLSKLIINEHVKATLFNVHAQPAE